MKERTCAAAAILAAVGVLLALMVATAQPQRDTAQAIVESLRAYERAAKWGSADERDQAYRLLMQQLREAEGPGR